MVYAQLGAYVFKGLIGFSTYSLSGTERLAEHALINLKPRLQHTGSDLRLLKFDITYHADFCIPEKEVKTLWDLKSLSTILPLIFGNGKVVGNFVISDIEETPTQTFNDGTYQEVRLSVSLKECEIPDQETQQQNDAKSNATAISDNSPDLIRGNFSAAHFTNTDTVTSNGIGALTSSSAVDSDLTQAITDPSSYAMRSQQIANYLDDIGYYLSTAQDAIDGDYISALEAGADFVPWDADVANLINTGSFFESSASNMASLLPITNLSLNSIINANTILQGAAQQYKLGLVNTVVQQGSRRI